MEKKGSFNLFQYKFHCRYPRTKSTKSTSMHPRILDYVGWIYEGGEVLRFTPKGLQRVVDALSHFISFYLILFHFISLSPLHILLHILLHIPPLLSDLGISHRSHNYLNYLIYVTSRYTPLIPFPSLFFFFIFPIQWCHERALAEGCDPMRPVSTAGMVIHVSICGWN